MGRICEFTTFVTAITLAVIAFPNTSLAGNGALRRCKPADDFYPSITDEVSVFNAISAAYINSAFPFREDSSPQSPVEREIDGVKKPTIILVLTDQNRLAKLLVKREGTDLLIQNFITYPLEAGRVWGWEGHPAAKGDNLRIAEDASLDLDRSPSDPSTGMPDLLWKKEGTASMVKPANGAQLKSVITIPVVAHRMKNRQSPNDVRTVFPIKASGTAPPLEDYFILSGKRVGMNAPWTPAGILFFLLRVEDCEYSLDEFPDRMVKESDAQESQPDKEVVPWPLSDCQARFRLINAAYNSPEVRGLDIYLWWRMDRAAGYAAAHRGDGPSPGAGAIWLDQTCSTDALSTPCGRLLAHEAGHFLGLCHICVTREVTDPEDRGRCGFCPNICECSDAHEDLLMRDDRRMARPRKVPYLTATEMEEARKKAWQQTRDH